MVDAVEMADSSKDYGPLLAILSASNNDELSTSSRQKWGSLEVSKSFYELGKIYYDKSDLLNAEKYFEKSLQYLKIPQDAFSMFKVLGFLIRIASEKLEKERGRDLISKATSLIYEMTQVNTPLEAEYFYNVGTVENYGGDFEKAGLNYKIAYDKSKEGDQALFSKCILSLAINFYNKGEYQSALEYMKKLEEVLQRNKKLYVLGAMHFYSARIYMKINQHDKALRSFSEANRILHGKKCWNLYGYILLGKGMIYKDADNYNQALTVFHLARESVDPSTFKRLSKLLKEEMDEVNDASVDICLDRGRRVVSEKTLGRIDFRHRFVLLEILFLLCNHRKKFFSKDELAYHIWKEEYNPLIHDKLVYTSISRLRKLIEPRNGKKAKIKYIIRGKDGYRFNPKIKVRFSSEEDLIGNVDISSPL